MSEDHDNPNDPTYRMINPTDLPPVSPKKKRVRKPKDNGNGAEAQGQMPAKSHLKLAEEAKVTAKAEQAASNTPGVPGTGKRRRIDLSKIKKADVSAPLGSIKRKYNSIPVRKPGNQKCIRTFPREFWLEDVAIAAREGDKQRKPYLFSTEMAAMVPYQVRLVTLVPYIDKQLNVCLWDLKQDNPDRPNDWNSTALNCAISALDEWGHIVNAGSEYGWIKGVGNWSDPEWPDLSIDDMVEKAFPGTYYIEEEDHPFIQELLGA